MIDSTVIGVLSLHCLSDRHAPVYGLLVGSLFEEENSAHLSGFIPCARNMNSLLENKLAVTSDAKQAALDKISSIGSNCIGSYCSDFSAIASFGNDLLLPIQKRTSTCLLLRIFVNNKIGTNANENGNFLSSLSAFVIKNGSLSTIFRVQIKIRDVMFTSQFNFLSSDWCIKMMLMENKNYFDSLLQSSFSHPGDRYVLACEFDRYLMNSLENDFIPQFNLLESEMKRISLLKQTLKAAIHGKLKQLQSSHDITKLEAIEQSISQHLINNNEPIPFDGRIEDLVQFKEIAFIQLPIGHSSEERKSLFVGNGTSSHKKVGRPPSHSNAPKKQDSFTKEQANEKTFTGTEELAKSANEDILVSSVNKDKEESLESEIKLQSISNDNELKPTDSTNVSDNPTETNIQSSSTIDI